MLNFFIINRSSIQQPKPDYEMATHMEGNLATEASMLVLDTLDLIVQVVSHTDHSQGLLASVLRVKRIKKSNFSCRFLNPNYFLQFEF